MKKIKIAHVTTVDMTLFGALLNQMMSILVEGYEVVGISSPGPFVERIQSAGIRHVPVRMTRRITPLADLVSLWRLFLAMRREHLTVVHTHNPKSGLLGQLAARMAGVPLVINTLHGFYFHDRMSPLARRFYILVEKLAARCSDLILSQSSEDVATAIAEGICPPGKIRHLGNGIDLRVFDTSLTDPALLSKKREELGIREGARVVGYVGRLVKEKGILELLRAAGDVRRAVPDVQFLIVGPADNEKAGVLTPEAARDHGVADACVFTGLRYDMPDLYALMDVFVLPSHREGFPRSSMEASAMGVPSVVTDVRGCREAIENGRNGLLVPLGDVEALAGAIIDLLRNGEKAARMGAEGRRMAQERFDERIMFEKVKETYAGLLSERGLCQAGTGTKEGPQTL